jgi:ketosteroid isomerase-like protein
MAAWNAGDAAAIAALYADDAVVMAPGAEPATGPAGSQISITPTEVVTSDGLAVEVGTFAEVAADGSHRDHGRYMVMWKNVDGKWTLYWDIWNSSM